MILVPDRLREHYLAKQWWGETSLADVLLEHAEKKPSALAVVDPPNKLALVGRPPLSWTWSETLDQVSRLVRVFQSNGLVKDDIIVVQLTNGLELQALYLACACTGVIISPIPLQYRAHEFRQIMSDLKAKWIIAETKVGEHACAAHWTTCCLEFPSIERILTIEALNLLWQVETPITPAELRQHMQEIALSAHDVLTVCWTSGTEAAPKGVPRNHNEWLIVGLSIIDAGQLKPDSRLLIPFPFVNMAGVSTCLAAWLVLGAELHHHHPFNLEVFLEQLRTHEFDYTVAAPAVLTQLLKNPNSIANVKLRNLKRIGSGGAAVPDWIVEQLGQRFGIELVNYYGSNEGAALSSSPQDIPDRALRGGYFPRFGIDGFPWSEQWSVRNSRKIRTRLVDTESGLAITEPGHIGELRFFGPTIFSGYFRRPELNATAFDEQGFYKSGDLFEIAGDQQQYYRFAGRKKDIVIRAGMNISSEEVESILSAHDAVAEAAVIGVPDAVMGERVCAVLVATNAESNLISLPELHHHLESKVGLARYKWPEHIVYVDRLPRNPIGKVLKRELRMTLTVPHVIFIPGMLNSAKIWNDTIAQLPSDWHCQVADIANIANIADKDDIAAPETIQAMAEKVWSIVKSCKGTGPIVLVGFSLGGYVLIEMLAKQLARIDAAILVSTSARPETNEGKLAREQMIVTMQTNFSEMAQSIASRGLHPDHADLRSKIFPDMLALGAQVAARQTRAIMHRSDHRGTLSTVTTPVRVICGQEDKVVPAKFSQEIADLLPNASIKILSPCGHMLPIEQPSALASEIINILNSTQQPHTMRTQ